MPEATRPKLLVFGESLGSFGTESAFDNIDQMLEGVDGALLVGPVFKNDIHNAVTDDRDTGSPFWRPVYKNGEHVRFAVDAVGPCATGHRVEVAARRLSAERDRPDHLLEVRPALEASRVARRSAWPRRLVAHVLGAGRHVLADRRRHGVLDRRARRPRARLRREPGRRVGRDHPPDGWTEAKTERLRKILATTESHCERDTAAM